MENNNIFVYKGINVDEDVITGVSLCDKNGNKREFEPLHLKDVFKFKEDGTPYIEFKTETTYINIDYIRELILRDISFEDYNKYKDLIYDDEWLKENYVLRGSFY